MPTSPTPTVCLGQRWKRKKRRRVWGSVSRGPSWTWSRLGLMFGASTGSTADGWNRFRTNDYAHAEVEPSGEVATLFDNDAWQLRVEAVHRPLAGWRGAFGVQFDDRDFSAEGEEAFIGPTQTQGTGIFLVEEKELPWGHLHVGGRIETLEHDNVDFSDYDEDAFSLAVGLETELTDEYQL